MLILLLFKNVNLIWWQQLYQWLPWWELHRHPAGRSKKVGWRPRLSEATSLRPWLCLLTKSPHSQCVCNPGSSTTGNQCRSDTALEQGSIFSVYSAQWHFFMGSGFQILLGNSSTRIKLLDPTVSQLKEDVAVIKDDNRELISQFLDFQLSLRTAMLCLI